jgi:copper chaperone
MVSFQVNDMTCRHCASAISRAVASVDKAARVDVRIQEKLVRVSSTASVAELAEAIQDAGYTPREVQAEHIQPTALRAASGCGCGCGCGPRKTASVDAGQAVAPARSSCCG